MSGYAYTTLIDPFDARHGMGTFALGINNLGQIVGYYADANGRFNGFLYIGGNYTTVDVPVAHDTWATGINDNGQIVGFDDFVSGGSFHGFLYSGSGYTAIDVPGATDTHATGINNNGQIVGYYNGGHSFLYSGGMYTTLDDPSATAGTVALGINDAGQVVGYYLAPNPNVVGGYGAHGFLYSNGNYTTIDFSTGNTYVTSINGNGQILGHDDAYDSFLYSNGSLTSLNGFVINGMRGLANSINNYGQVVGYYLDTSSLNTDGFRAIPTTTVTWAAPVSGDFAVASNWSPPTVPGQFNDAALSPSGTYTVTSSVNETVNSLTTAAGATLSVTGGTFTINAGTGSGVNAGTMMVSNAPTTLHVIGPIAGPGSVVINGGTLDLTGSYDGLVTFTGPGGTFVGDAGNHNLAGDGMGNVLDYSSATTGVQFNFSTGYAYNNFSGGNIVGVDHFSDIYYFRGGKGNDVFYGGPGNHSISGGAGVNTLDYSAATTGVQFYIGNGGPGVAYNNFSGGNIVGVDNFFSILTFLGGSGDDYFYVDSSVDNDVMDGGGGVNTLDYSQTLSGYFSNSVLGVFIDFAAGTARFPALINGPTSISPTSRCS